MLENIYDKYMYRNRIFEVFNANILNKRILRSKDLYVISSQFHRKYIVCIRIRSYLLCVIAKIIFL